MARRSKTGLPAHVWRKVFGAVAKYCAKARAPGETMNECVKRVWSQFKGNIRGLIEFLKAEGVLPADVAVAV